MARRLAVELTRRRAAGLSTVTFLLPDHFTQMKRHNSNHSEAILPDALRRFWRT